MSTAQKHSTWCISMETLVVKFCDNATIMHMWQSRVEIEQYSVVYFDRITTFAAL